MGVSAGAAAVAALSAANAGYQQERQQDDASKAKKYAEKKQDHLAKEAQQRAITEVEREDAVAKRDAEKKKQEQLLAQGMGRSGTILTGPLGMVGGAAGARKTALGV